MKNKVRTLRQAESGFSTMIGAVVIFLIAGTIFGTVQAHYVPQWNQDIEKSHLDRVYDDMMALKSDIEDVAVSGEPKSGNIRLGERYPDRLFFANPGAGVAGSLTSDNLAVSIEYTIDGPGDPTVTTSYSSNRISYEVQGTIDSPKLVYENGVVIRDYDGESASADQQSLIAGDGIYIPVLLGSLTSVSSMETQSIAISPLPLSYSRSNIKSVTIILDTDYPQVWQQLLAGVGGMASTEVDLDEGKIIINSTGVRQISFPSGDMTADVLYAGMVIFGTQSGPVTGTSVDPGRDYPSILDISIDEGGIATTRSTITVTVRNATAPFDIHADFTSLTGDPAMHDVFPDYSSPDSISSPGWEVPNENTVRWTNVTHPEFDVGDSVVISFWVINTENSMQFLTQRVFLRRNANSWY
jgi:hypothetical protein